MEHCSFSKAVADSYVRPPLLPYVLLPELNKNVEWPERQLWYYARGKPPAEQNFSSFSLPSFSQGEYRIVVQLSTYQSGR